jgi:hypothetical protein
MSQTGQKAEIQLWLEQRILFDEARSQISAVTYRRCWALDMRVGRVELLNLVICRASL